VLVVYLVAIPVAALLALVLCYATLSTLAAISVARPAEGQRKS
jgi:hypothetical protein